LGKQKRKRKKGVIISFAAILKSPLVLFFLIKKVTLASVQLKTAFLSKLNGFNFLLTVSFSLSLRVL